MVMDAHKTQPDDVLDLFDTPAQSGAMDELVQTLARKGRGAVSNATGRFEAEQRVATDDGWGLADEPAPALHTQYIRDATRTIISRNDSPDIGFDRSINPYRGCEHGCVYCFARPTHAYLGMSPGLDFESKILTKENAPTLLANELRKPSYRCQPIAMGTNTDPYQPAERKLEITRGILEVLREFHHPITIVTKSALIQRDIDILADLAKQNLAAVAVSVTTLDRHLARTLEPRAATPERRIETIAALSAAGIPTAVMAAPMIPALNDAELETILERAVAAGASGAGYTMLRLPLEVAPLFVEWLNTHVPDKAKHVMSLIRQSHGGKDYDAQWGKRMRGTGPYAEMLRIRFETAYRRLKLNQKPRRSGQLDTTKFAAPPKPSNQFSLAL
jgi:DNA repair photolyase